MLWILAPPVSLASTMANLLAGCDEWVHFSGYFGSLLAYGYRLFELVFGRVNPCAELVNAFGRD